MVLEILIYEYWDFLTFSFFGGLFLSLYFLCRRDPYVSYILEKDFKGPKSYPVIGNALNLLVKPHEFLEAFQELRDAYGHSYRMWLGNEGLVVLTRAKEAEKILSNANLPKADSYRALHNWIGFGLITSNGPKWQSRRKLLTPTFHFKILDEFSETMNEHTEILINLLEKKSEAGKPFEISKFLSRCTLDILCETVMGKRINSQMETDNEYIKATSEATSLSMKRFRSPWLGPKIIWDLFSDGWKEKAALKILHDFSDSVIREKKRERLESKNLESSYEGKKRKAFLDLLLDISENGQVISDQGIREETDTFMFAGHDTTATNLLWTIFLLARHPEHQKKVQEELDEIFGYDRARPVNNADMAKMKYLECCIKESLRLFPSVPFTARNITQDITFDDGAVLPKGSQAFIHTYLIHHDPQVFPEPDQFRPERFSPENLKGRNPYAFIPFSAGLRNCIGQKFAMQEEKIILSKILLNFELETKMDPNQVRKVADVTLRPIDEILIKIIKRKR